ncbi:MAG: transcription termination factor NusA [Planctomycetota bacterium]|jgi:N utilization substance protein A
MSGDFLRIVDAIHRDKKIDKEIVLRGIVSALTSAARKHYRLDEDADVEILIDEKTGDISAVVDGRTVAPEELGRIAAQTAKQVIIQKIREAEQDVLYEEYQQRAGTLVNGIVRRFEGPNVIISLGKTEGILPRSEQIFSESYQPGDRLRLYILEVKRVGSKTRIVLSRTDPDLVQKLFELEVPEIAEHIIAIRSIAREAGYRSKVAVQSSDPKIDCVGACVGVRGSRIKSIVEELNGEKIDIVRWSNEDSELVAESLKPAKVGQIYLDEESRVATVVVDDSQLSLAIGRRGQNVRLASRLSGWDIEIVSKLQLAERATESITELSSIPEVDDKLARSLYNEGFESLQDIADAGEQRLAGIAVVGPQKALEIMARLRQMAEEYAKSGAPTEGDADEDAAEAVDAAEAGDATDAGDAAEAVDAAEAGGAAEAKDAAETENDSADSSAQTGEEELAPLDSNEVVVPDENPENAT